MDAINTHMQMLSGEGPNTMAPIQVRPEDITLQDNVMIPIKVLDLVSHSLRFDSSERGLHGFIPPSIIHQHALENQELPVENRVPDNGEGINIHYLNSQHYVTSHKSITMGQASITIYDSIPPGERVWNLRLRDLPSQLTLLYGDVQNIEVVCSQNQGRYTHNCGVYAIANSLMLLHGQNPCDYQLKPRMRAQLITMLNNGIPQMRLFNAEKRNHPYNLDMSSLTRKRRLQRSNSELQPNTGVSGNNLGKSNEIFTSATFRNVKRGTEQLSRKTVSSVPRKCFFIRYV